MKRLFLAIIILVSPSPVTAQTTAREGNSSFRPAQIVSVTDIPAYNHCFQGGAVVLDALIAESGEVQAVEVRRDLTCASDVAARAVRNWKFSAATFEGKAMASRIPVAVTFASALSTGPVSLPALIPRSAVAIQAEFQPAEVLHAEFPPFHAGYTYAQGTVVIEVKLGATGKQENLKVLRDIPPFTAAAKAAAEHWQFMPATLNGQPVRSRVVLAFVSPPVVIPN